MVPQDELWLNLLHRKKYLGQGSNLHSLRNQILRVVLLFANALLPELLQIM
jgi:hypothetical protein